MPDAAISTLPRVVRAASPGGDGPSASNAPATLPLEPCGLLDRVAIQVFERLLLFVRIESNECAHHDEQVGIDQQSCIDVASPLRYERIVATVNLREFEHDGRVRSAKRPRSICGAACGSACGPPTSRSVRPGAGGHGGGRPRVVVWRVRLGRPGGRRVASSRGLSRADWPTEGGDSAGRGVEWRTLRGLRDAYRAP